MLKVCQIIALSLARTDHMKFHCVEFLGMKRGYLDIEVEFPYSTGHIKVA